MITVWPKIYCSLCVLCFLGLQSYGQQLDSLSTNLDRSQLKTSESILFVHFDKNVYANNEDVWLSAYLIKAVADLASYHTLFISLVNNADSNIVLQRKFLINNGLSYGSFKIPDSVFTGSYRLVANTNIKYDNKPDVEFIQPISIKSSNVNPLQATISVFKSYDAETKEGIVLLKASTGDNRFVEGAKVKYEIGNQNEIIKKGSTKTSVIGEVMIRYPADQITETNNRLSVAVEAKNKIRHLTLSLPYPEKPKYQLQFFPEGGYMVDGVNSTVGFEIKDSQNAKVGADLILYQDDDVLDTISSNSIGIGRFELTPKAGKKYTVRIIDTTKSAQAFPLPQQLKKGIGIKLANALATDDLNALIESSYNTKAFLLVHNYKEIMLYAPLDLYAHRAQKVRLNFTDLPKGLKTITILDSLYRPVAERLFFARYDEIDQIDIETDKEEYKTREKVNLRVKAIGKNDSIYAGLVSVAVVQSNRVLTRNKQDINSYLHFENDLGPLPNVPSGLKFKNTDYLEDILLIKAWRKYKWPAENQNGVDRTKLISSTEFIGQITKSNKPLKKPMKLTTFGAAGISSLTSDSLGRFQLSNDHLMSTHRNGKVWLSLAENKSGNYNVTVNDPVDDFKEYLKHQNFQENVDKSVSMISSRENMLPQTGIRLKEVVIKKNTDKFFVSNRCGDYVCMYNILNCPNHLNRSDNRLPIKGQTYKTGSGQESVIYNGCEDGQFASNNMLINGINLPKEFYVSDIGNKDEPIDFATVFWQYQLRLNKGAATPLSFNTGDLKGNFKIVIQGLTENGVAYGEKDIEIKSP